MKKIKIGFLGYGTRALDYLMAHPGFEVRYFFAPKARLCEEVFAAERRYRKYISLEVIEDNRQLAQRFGEISDADCFLMNACSIILNCDVLSRMPVYNIHPGDLRYNRGHQPHCWTVLLGEQKTKIVLHQANESIDAGRVIRSVEVEVTDRDSAGDVLAHAEDQIPVLLDALYRYLTGHGEYEDVVENGGYRRIMTYEDYEIHLPIDTREQMKRKILARSTYHGAFFRYGAERIYVDDILSYQEYQRRQDSAIAIRIEEEAGMVYINSVWRSIVFHLHQIVQEEGRRFG